MEDDILHAVLDTVIICTTRMNELAEFYRLGLGLDEPKPQGDAHLGFYVRGTYLGFDQVEEDQFLHPGAHSLWFRVNNIEEAFEHLRNIGARVKYPPTKKPWGDTLAAVFDPDGNVLGLAQR